MIKLNSLKLENFMCVENAFLDFKDQKVIILLGDNGNGKSTVLDAISLCLTESKRGDTYKDYIQRGKKSAHIVLDAEVKGSPILFDISIMSSGTALERSVTYKKIRETPFKNSEVTELLNQLDLPYFGEILMSAQDDDNITKKSPMERARYLKNLLNFSFESETEFCKNKLEDIKTSIKKNEETISISSNLLTVKKDQIQEVPDDIYSNRITELNSAISVINKALEKYSDLTTKQQTLSASMANIVRDKATLQTTIDNLNKQIENLPTLKEDISKYNIANNNLSTELSTITNSLTVLNDTISKLTESQNNVDTEKSNVIQKLATEKANLATITKHLSLIDSGKCPECGHEFTSADRSQYESLYNDKNSEVNNLAKQVEELQQKSNSLTQDRNNIVNQLSSSNNRIVTINSTMSNNNTNKLKLQEQVDLLEKTASTELESKKSELNTVLINEAKLIEQNNALVNDLNDYSSLNTDLRNAQTQVNDLNKQLLVRENIIKTNAMVSDEIKILSDNINNLTATIEKLHSDEKIYKEAFTLLSKNLPDYLTVKTCDILESEMNDFIHVVFPKMEIKLFQNKKGIEFFYTDAYIDGMTKEQMSNAKMASGFEKVILSLAFKVALCKSYNLSFAFFDEADEHSSDKNAEKVFKSLLTNGLFDQVFLISHKGGVRDIVKSNAEGVRTYYVDHGKFSLDSNY